METFDTPITLLVFNRPDKTKKVLDQIRLIKPKKLLVVCDSAREHISGEKEKVDAVRSLFNDLDWECEVERNFATENMGCKKRVSSGIEWAFSIVEASIFLEDDCLPSLSFFGFCQELLEKYKNQRDVGMVCGYNPLPSFKSSSDFYFTKYPHIWGWASWRDRWDSYDLSMTAWATKREEILNEVSHDDLEKSFWSSHFDGVFNGKIDTWDAQVSLMFFTKKLLALMPRVSLIENLGFDEEATHTHSTLHYQRHKAEDLSFPLCYPEAITANSDYDKLRAKLEYNTLSFLKKVVNKIKGYFI